MLQAVKLKTRTIVRHFRTIVRHFRTIVRHFRTIVRHFGFFPLNIMQVMTVFSFIKIIKRVKRINDCLRMQVTVLGRYAPQQFTCMRGKRKKREKERKAPIHPLPQIFGAISDPWRHSLLWGITDPTAGIDLRSNLLDEIFPPPAAGQRYIYVTLCI